MLRPWSLEVEINRESGVSIHRQITQTIITEIQRGRFSAGIALPGSRELASKLGVNRKTVVQAYEDLIAQGWLSSESKRGTFVSSRIQSNIMNLSCQPQEGSIQQTKKSHSEARKKTGFPIIEFNEGISDSRLMPLEPLSRAMRHALISTCRTNRPAYVEPCGAAILRQAILHMLNISRGLHANLENICIVRGAQMGLFLIARVLIQPNDIVVMENLCNPMASNAFKSANALVLPISQNQNGIDLDALEKLCISTKIRAVYVNPNYQVPTTVTMPMENRLRLIALAEKYDFLIIEHDHDVEFHYTKKPLMPISSFDHANRVIYIGSFSNILTPTFRIGYVVASHNTTKLFSKEIQLIDRQGNTMTELAVAELIHTGEVARHTLKASKIYEQRLKFASELISRELGDFVQFTVPDGGLALWLKVNHQINLHTLLQYTEQEKLRVVTGAHFSLSNTQAAAIRLGFASMNHEELSAGINRLKRAFTRLNNPIYN
jgi:GntR family transcriptional regulator / MocR family aminotransferase